MATQFGAEYEEIGYEGVIENEDGGFVLLPDGNYDFTVNKVTRSRYEGSDKMPPCDTVSVELTVWGAQDKTIITERFFCIRKFEWKLSQFFLSIGLKKHGEQIAMRWNIEGYKGKCKVYIDNYKKQDGSDGQSNKIKKFYAYDEQVQTVSSTAPPQQYQASPQQQYQASPQQQYQQTYQQYQAPAQTAWQNTPAGAPRPQSSGGWSAGKF